MSTRDYLDFSKTDDFDDSTTQFEYVEYVDENTNDPNQVGQRTINTRGEDIYLLEHKAFSRVREKIRQAGGADYPAGSAVTLQNNVWSIFKSARYQIASQIIEDIF